MTAAGAQSRGRYNGLITSQTNANMANGIQMIESIEQF